VSLAAVLVMPGFNAGSAAGAQAGCLVARHVVHLGGKQLAGNPSPVTASIRKGARVTVIARFGQRRLTIPAADDNSILAEQCHERDGYRVFATFRAEHRGRTLVRVSTDDCAPCAQLVFEARIRVKPRR